MANSNVFGNWFNWNQPAPVLPSYPTLNTYGYPNSTLPPNGSGWNLNNPTPNFNSNPYPNSNPGVLFPSNGPTYPYSTNWSYPNAGYPNGVYPNNGSPWNNWWYNTSNAFNYSANQTIRLFQGPRFRHTWIAGTDNFDGTKNNSVEINDSDVSLLFAIPRFLGSTQSLYIIPSYSQHVWEGPKNLSSDLPANAFSAFIDSAWETNPVQTIGAELGLRVGVFSAFDAINSESIRIQGKGLGRLRLTSASTLRAGVYYLDRNKIKLLPAVGILWLPNPDTRFDIFFPEPKLSHYLTTVGNTDVWWYLTGMYGGGAWTIKRADGTNEEIDLNDIRVMFGLEYGRTDQLRQGSRIGFLEGGYAFNRELIYRNKSADNLNLENSFVVRAGFAY